MNIRDEIVIKKIIQYADEIDETISRFNLTHEYFTEDFIAMQLQCVSFKSANWSANCLRDSRQRTVQCLGVKLELCGI